MKEARDDALRITFKYSLGKSLDFHFNSFYVEGEINFYLGTP